MRKLLAAGSALLLLFGCARPGADRARPPAGGSAPRAAPPRALPPAPSSILPKPPSEVVTFAEDPYPSTYQPYPSRPTLIRGATVFDGAGKRIAPGQLLLRDGKVAAIGAAVPAPPDALVLDAAGKWVTPGIIDAHSHLGASPSPDVQGHSDENEGTAPVHADVWVEHSVWPHDPGFSRALVNGGVTALHILPGSADLFGGRGTTFKNVPAVTMQAMKFPGAPYSLKMACGENPKRVHGRDRGRSPYTRMGNIAIDRQAWANALRYRHRWNDYWERARDGRAKPSEAPQRDLGFDTMVGVLEGRLLVQNHCYRADEMAVTLDMAREFGYRVAAFHHAVEAYKIADLLAREKVCAAMWADWWGFKMEAYDGISENIALVHRAGGCAIVHSDDPGGIQRLNQEAAKAMAAGRRIGIDVQPEEAWAWLSLNPARALGIDRSTGSLAPGKMADVVLWNGDPFSVYTRPEKIWVDGALLYDALDPARRPVSDFELGQPGNRGPK